MKAAQPHQIFRFRSVSTETGSRNTSDDYRQEAIDLLVSYFRLAFEDAGVTFGGDNQAEIETLVDSIIRAAFWEMKRELELKQEQS